MKVVVVKKKSLIACLSIIISLIIVTLTVGFTASASILAFGKTRKLPIYCVQTNEKKVAITFDCAWGVDYTDTLLDIMQQKQVVSTFFMVEFWTEKYPDYVKKIFDAGHDIGTHSATHPYMSKLDSTAVINELTSSCNAIENITGQSVKVFRPPYGDYNDNLIECAEQLGLYTIQWDVDSLDWKNLTAKQIYERVTGKVKNGSIVLFHNNGLHTADALPDVIDYLKENGYQFVTVYDLIYKDNYVIDHSGKQIYSGKNV